MVEARPRLLIYILRHDVRLSDNPIFHAASLRSIKQESDTKSLQHTDTHHHEDFLVSKTDVPIFTHLLPVYIFPAHQVEVSGFIPDGSGRSPYPDARSRVAGVWRTGPHRAKFMADGVWDLKQQLESLGCNSGLHIRVGQIGDVVNNMLDWYAGDDGEDGKRADIEGIWITSEEGTEEKSDELRLKRIAERRGVGFKVWDDEKYYIDDRDLPIDDISDLPDVYTTYRKTLEPLRLRPRRTLPTPKHLPPLPPDVPPQKDPFEIPQSLDGLKRALLRPLEADETYGLPSPPRWPTNVRSAHPFDGGETAAHNRLEHLISSGSMSSYKATRNGMLGLDFSTKLSAFLAQGYITARQVHWAMSRFEEGNGPGESVSGYGKGENDGTAAVRFELLWRDYMRLCARKYGHRMFDLRGIQNPKSSRRYESGKAPQRHWKFLDHSGGTGDDPKKTREAFTRFRSGKTGIGLIDASQRELFLTGYTSNRARQNVASFLASHLGIDWRIGAEWYECMLTDYDMASNWGNWQYVAGVGNDPRLGRVFNPVKQALDYDGRGEYIKAWVSELREVKVRKNEKDDLDKQKLMGLYQAWRLEEWEKEKLGLKGLEWVEQPLVRIQFSVSRGSNGRGRRRGRGGRWDRGRGNRRLGNEEKVGAQSLSVGEAGN